jgi:hypothetical protein
MRFLATLLVLASTAAYAAPTQIAAEYRLTANGIPIGKVNETFARKGATYAIQSVSRSDGVLKAFYDDQITIESSGRVGAGGLQPLEYAQRRARDPSKNIKAQFDWDKGVMRSFADGKQSDVPLPRETQDRISVMYQFMNIDRRGDTVVMPMADGRRVEYYTYRFVQQEKVTTPAGEFDTFHYERVTQEPDERKAEVWLAKDRFNFPVRVVFDDPKGFRIEQLLVDLQSN